MTLAYIKSNTLRRTAIILLIPVLPFLFFVTSVAVALPIFWEQFTGELTQGGTGLWRAIKDCWRGVDVRRSNTQIAHAGDEPPSH
jgi:hypothetical protein